MNRTSIALGAIAILAAGCVSTRPQPSQPPAQAGGAKQIVRVGAQLALPDGTLVTPDASGGFQLPNGDYVRRDRGGLILPTGARCAASADGYICP